MGDEIENIDKAIKENIFNIESSNLPVNFKNQETRYEECEKWLREQAQQGAIFGNPSNLSDFEKQIIYNIAHMFAEDAIKFNLRIASDIEIGGDE